MNLAETYRPKTLDEVAGQSEIIECLKENLQSFGLHHMIFAGPPGTGKTTIALILGKMNNIPVHEYNASDDRGINVVRNEIKTVSRYRGKRIILLDEADHLTSDAQAALRRTLEKAQDAVFILTGNYLWRIIEPIQSRCSVYEFKRLEDTEVLRQILKICKAENIQIDSDAKTGLVQLLQLASGDMRKALSILSQVVGKEKKITAKMVLSFSKPHVVSEALSVALNGDFERAKDLIEEAFLSNRQACNEIIKELYESIHSQKDRATKARLYVKLSEVEHACKTEADPILPLVHLVGFISYAWLCPHFSTKCPVIQGVND